jgi:hypothetical protein
MEMKHKHSKRKSANDLNNKREIEDKLEREKERRDKSRRRTRGPYRKASLHGRVKKLS